MTPACLAHLPVCPVRRLPIPYSSGRDPDGTGRFGVNDLMAKLACALGGLCGICGKPMSGLIVFLAVDDGQDLPACVFGDPGMCPPCAEASMRLCPYISRPRVPSRLGGGAKPGWIWVACDRYQPVIGRGPGVIAFRPVPPLAVRRFTYGPAGLTERRTS